MCAQPLQYEVLDEETKHKLQEEDELYVNNCIRVGDKKWFFLNTYADQNEAFRNFKTNPSDVWVLSLPKSGANCMQELVWLLENNLDYDSAVKYKLDTRFPFFDTSLLQPHSMSEEYFNMSEDEAEKVNGIIREGKTSPEIIAAYPSPRYIKSQLPFEMLPTDLLDSGAKIIYVARHPKNVAASYYYFRQRMPRFFKFKADFKTFWNFFTKSLILYTPYWDHVKEAWKRRDDPNFLFVFYEEMQNDLPKIIERVAEFLGKSYSTEEVGTLADHLDANFQENDTVAQNDGEEVTLTRENKLIGKGDLGELKDLFTPELEAEADEWIEENLKDTDLSWPV
ncbi:sulfotransferase 4A1 [Cephus cinctus]|uniref:Sulfotransferase 4A1 n=1 Tax=Cephus cinctus TaxID=211228 RepID=A0AAJ7BZ25_CEPCN|nr:sulfotransferase 4A1 [Cephus cinctus]